MPARFQPPIISAAFFGTVLGLAGLGHPAMNPCFDEIWTEK
jgi:hypothetical protein